MAQRILILSISMMLRFFMRRRRISIAMLLVVPLLLGVWMRRVASWRPKIADTFQGDTLALEWDSDGKTFHCASRDGRHRLFSASTLEVLTSNGNPGPNRNPGWEKGTFAATGKLLLTTDLSTTRLWAVPAMRTLWWRDTNDSKRDLWRAKALGFALSADGDYLACAESAGGVWVWDIKNGEVQVRRDAKTCICPKGAETVGLSADGNLVAYGGKKPGIGVWSKQGHRHLWTARAFPSRADPQVFVVTALRFSPDGERLAVSLNGEMLLLNSRTGAIVRTLAVGTEEAQANSLAFSLDGQLLAQGGDDGNVRVWDLATGRTIVDAPTGERWVNCVAFSPDGGQIAVGTEGGRVELWRTR